jgi:putative peptidoglycan lipid II flippase
MKENSVKGASVILIVTLTLSNILGVFRDHFLAQKIPTDRLDIYFAAFRLPDLIFNVLILGSVAAAFVPIYSQYLKEKGDKEANNLAQATITIGTSAVVLCLIILFFLMPTLMKVLVPSFTPDKMAETVKLGRYLLLSPLFFTVSYFLGGLLNSHKRFLAYSIAPLVYNLSIILGVLLLAGRIGVGGAVVGVIVGSFLHMLVQIPTALKVGFKPALRFDFNQGVKKIMTLMVPRAIALGTNQLLLVVYTAFASAFAGGIAIYTFADNIQTVPSVIFGTSFATAVFPTLAGLSMSVPEDKERFSGFFTKTLRAALFFLVPSTLILILLRAQIIRLILGYGYFGWADTKTATATLGFFALSIIAQGLVPLFARSFYAMHNTKTPMIVSIISICISITLGFVFSRLNYGLISGVAGLALAFTAGSWVSFTTMAILICRKIKVDIVEIFGFVLQITLLSLIMIAAMQFTKDFVGSVYDIDRVRFLALQTGAALAVGAGVYFIGAFIMRIREVRS